MLRNPKASDIGKLTGIIFSIKKAKEHYMKIHEGFGMSECVIDELTEINPGILVRIKYDNHIYETTLGAFRISKLTYDNNGDPQRFVKLKDMEMIR